MSKLPIIKGKHGHGAGQHQDAENNYADHDGTVVSVPFNFNFLPSGGSDAAPGEDGRA